MKHCLHADLSYIVQPTDAGHIASMWQLVNSIKLSKNTTAAVRDFVLYGFESVTGKSGMVNFYNHLHVEEVKRAKTMKTPPSL